jgi:hypothetical protein
MGDEMRDDSEGSQLCFAPSAKFAWRIGRLEDRLFRITLQMRRSLLSLCGATKDEGDNVMHRMFRLRQRMRATRRRISNLKYQDRARN